MKEILSCLAKALYDKFNLKMREFMTEPIKQFFANCFSMQ